MATNYAEVNESPLDINELLENPYRLALEQDIQRNGIGHFNTFLQNYLHRWQLEPLNIAIIGETGVGKSTVINTMRDLPPTHPQAAHTSGQGVGTTEVKAYPDMDNPNLIYFDLPGIGAADMDQSTCLATSSLNKYDFFILLCRERFTNNEMKLGKKLQEMQKKFYFVRTRIDETLRNKREDAEQAGEVFSESAYIEQIRQQCHADFERYLPGQHRLFVISGRLNNYKKWDFPDLIIALINNAPDLKREALLFSIRANSHEIINRKVEQLKQRILLAALLSAGVAAVPVPGLFFACDIGIIAEELRHYMKQLSIDDDALLRLSHTRGISSQVLRRVVFGVGATIWSSEGADLLQLATTRLAAYATANVVEEIARYIPVIGQVVGAGISFTTVYAVLQILLKEFTKAAHTMVDQST